MEQTNKNKKLTIIVGALLVVIGISFAYFLASLLIEGNGANTKLTTARINGATIQVDGNIEFNDQNILPGHKTISSVELTATGQNQIVAYNLIWQGTNSLNTPLNYYVYKTTEPITTGKTCTPQTSTVSGMQVLSENCTITNIDQLGSIIGQGTINKSTTNTKVVLLEDEMINARSGAGTVVYYYVVLEYPNLPTAQDEDMGGTLDGVVTVEASSAQADISVVAIYKDGEQVNEIPQSEEGYILDEEASSCTNNATPIWNESDWSLEVNNLNKSGTDCNLYFKKPEVITKDDIVKGATSKGGSFEGPTTASSSEAGLFKTSDPVYGNDTYYYRGLVTNNYVSFANKCWRIVRINGNGSIRIIYDGTTCHGNGENADSITHTGIKYNNSNNDNAYVGYMFGTTPSSKYDDAHKNTNPSNIKGILDGWYTSNIDQYISGTSGPKYSDYIDREAGFCNDRSLAAQSTGKGYGTQETYYGAYERTHSGTSWAGTQTPSFGCTNEDDDLFTPSSSSRGNHQLGTKPIGLITADEVVFAGGFGGTASTNYWLYNKQYYWTMSPFIFNGTNASVFRVYSNGNLVAGDSVTSTTCGVRPVINLRAGTVFDPETNGSSGNPYKAIIR